MLKGLPLAYNKDMQEDKESLFDGAETVIKCLEIFAPMVKTMRVKRDNMYRAAGKGFINATDLADYLTKRGVPFRTAYKITGGIVADCIKSGLVLDELPIEKYREYSDIFDKDVYSEISLEACIEKRISEGSTGKASVDAQLKILKDFLENCK